tara:strand:- start:442 stop:936 length:495 start_codon:yes stop_codon:yes gene_type:complete
VSKRLELIMEALDKGKIETHQDALDISNDKDFNVYRDENDEIIIEIKAKLNVEFDDNEFDFIDESEVETWRKPKTPEQLEKEKIEAKNRKIRKAERERKERIKNYKIKDDAIYRVHDRNNKENRYEFIISDELQKIIDENNDFSDELNRLEEEKFNRMIKRNKY